MHGEGEFTWPDGKKYKGKYVSLNQEHTLRTKRKDTGCLHGLMEGSIRECGRTVSNMGRVLSSIRMAMSWRLNGTKEKESKVLIRAIKEKTNEITQRKLRYRSFIYY